MVRILYYRNYKNIGKRVSVIRGKKIERRGEESISSRFTTHSRNFLESEGWCTHYAFMKIVRILGTSRMGNWPEIVLIYIINRTTDNTEFSAIRNSGAKIFNF